MKNFLMGIAAIIVFFLILFTIGAISHHFHYKWVYQLVTSGSLLLIAFDQSITKVAAVLFGLDDLSIFLQGRHVPKDLPGVHSGGFGQFRNGAGTVF